MPRSTSIVLAARCDQACGALCDCAAAPSAADAAGVPRAVRAGGARLDLRGAPARDPAFAATLAAAAAAGWGEVWVRTTGAAFATPEAARGLAAAGVRGATVPLFAHVSAVHDRLAGRPGALVDALRGLRALAAAGVAVAVEVPLLPPRLQDPAAVVALALRAVPGLAGVRFYAPHGAAPLPAALAPAPWGAARPGLAAALAACRAAGVAAPLRATDGVPLCAVGHLPAHAAAYALDPRRPARPRAGFAHAAACAGCAVRAHCLGPGAAYRAAHGGRDLAPFAARPRAMFEQRTTPRRAWLPHQRAAARAVLFRVVRPTIHCNQDCPFCSANETTENVLPAAGDMLRRIARFARQGVTNLSFSGGEPTLSKDLVHYVRAAARLGIHEIELVTNGVLLDAPERVQALADAGLTMAFVSLHGHDELVARRTTAKDGDWARTVRAVGALAAARVRTTVNHVISALNYPYLPRFAEFVVDTWGARVGVSFAMVTPQFRALDHAALVPRITDVMPYLRRAMRTLALRRAPFVVGSRQGIPPCFLGPYAGWSDLWIVAARARAEDEPQKVRAPQCARCRYSRQCAGVWRPYAARYGTDELVPVPGAPLTDADVRALRAAKFPPRGFAGLPPLFRAEPPPPEAEPAPPAPARREPRRLPVVQGAAPPALRVALLGAGPRAQRLAAALAAAPGLALAGVASPHLGDRPAAAFGAAVRMADAAALLDAVRPDAVVVAAATAAHHALAALAVARGLPVLVEAPLAQTRDQAAALAALAPPAFVMAAHDLAFAPGARALAAAVAAGAVGRVLRAACTRRVPAGDPGAPAAWSRDALYAALYPAAYLLGAAAGGGAAVVGRVEARGAARPEWVRAALRYPDGVAGELVLDFAAAAAVTELAVAGEHGRRLAWRREGADEVLVRATPGGDRTTSVAPGDAVAAMLAAFGAAVRAGAAPPTPAREGAAAMGVAAAILDGLAAHLARPGAPKHVASPGLRSA